MTHFTLQDGLDITILDKAEIKHKEMDRVHRGTGRARSTSLEEILMMYVKGRDAVHKIVETAPRHQTNFPLAFTFQVPRIICPNRHTYGFDSM